MNSFDFAFVTWWPLIFYPVTDAPNYHKGYIASLVTGALTLPLIAIVTYLEKRDRARGLIGRLQGISSSGSSQNGNETDRAKGLDSRVQVRSAEADF